MPLYAGRFSLSFRIFYRFLGITFVTCFFWDIGLGNAATESKSSLATPPPGMRVTITGLPLAISQIGDSLSIVPAKTMVKDHTTFVTEELQRVPGVFSFQDGGPRGVSTVRIRGQNREDTLLVIDDMIVTDPSAPQPAFDFSRLMVDGEHGLSVLRGSQGVLYGTQAIGGVVALTSPRGRGPLRGSVLADGGNHETSRVGLNAHGGLDGNRWGYRLSLQNFFTQGVSSARTFSRLPDETDKFRLGYGYGRVDYDFSPNLSVRAVTYNTRGRSHYDTCSGPALSCDVAGLYDNFSNSAGRLSAHTTSDTGKVTGDFGVTYNLGERHGFLWALPTYGYKGSMVIADGKATVTVSPKQKVSLGVESRVDQSMSHGGFGGFSDYASVGMQSLFLLSQSAPTPAVDLALGGRVDHNGTFGLFPTYRASVSYRPGALNRSGEWGVRLTSALARGFRAPSLFELYGRCCGGRLVGNPGLNPETSISWDAGFHLTSPKKQFGASVTYFRLATDNDISWDMSEFSYSNRSGVIDTQGVETEVAWRLSDTITLNQAYTYTQATQSSGEKLTCRPAHVSSTFVNTSFDHGRGNAVLSGVYVLGNRSRTSRLPANFLLNAAVEYALTSQFMVYGRVDNVGNETYDTCTGYRTEGRMARVGLKITF